MYALFLDALAALRLRFHPAEHYRYNPAVILGALLVVGAINAAAMAPLFGSHTGAVAFGVALTVLKWAVLSAIMAKVLHYYGAPKRQLYGFSAMTGVLAAPLIAMLYWPQYLGLVGTLWQAWIFVVQIIGLTRLSGQSGLKVLLGYLAYFIILMLAGSLLLMIFNAMGWLDIQALAAEMQKITQTPQP